jgi:malonate transporter and related proteins
MSLLLHSMLPMVIIILIGYRFGEKCLGENGAAILNKFVYYFGFPALIFTAIAGKKLHDLLNYRYMILFALGSFIVYYLCFVLFMRGFRHDKPNSSLRALAGAFPNCAYIGFPFVTALLGDEAIVPAVLATIFALFVLIGVIAYNDLLIHATEGVGSVFTGIAKAVFMNPIIVSFLAGFTVAAFQLKLPNALAQPFNYLGSAAVPVALLAIGQLMTGMKLGSNLKDIWLICAAKIVLQPAIVFALLLLSGLSPIWIVIGTIMAGLSTGLIIPTLADRFNAFKGGATEILIVSTVASLLTLSLWVLVLRHLYPDLPWHQASAF